MTVCLDTNVFLQIFGRNQPYHSILRALLDGRLTLAVSTEILLQYEELRFPALFPAFDAEPGLPSCWLLWDWLRFDLTPHEDHMNANSTIDEIRTALAKLQAEHEVLVKSHRRLVAKVLKDPTAAEQFLGQMAVDRVIVYSQ